jgi:filamentous hemagglutinin
VQEVTVNRFNRQLSDRERQWASDDAEQFAKRYEEKTGKSLTAEQARNMLLGTGYRMVDAAASKGPGGDPIAAAYISENGGDMFRATPGEYKDPFRYGNKDLSLTSEQRVLPGSIASPALGLGVATALTGGGAALGLRRSSPQPRRPGGIQRYQRYGRESAAIGSY